MVSGGSGGCTPEWGGVTPIGSDPVAAQIGALRAMGGDVRISFGGEDGSELAETCTSVSQLQAAYQQVISAYDVNKLDFDIEGAAIDNTAANNRRDQALAALQQQDKGLQISFTLPVLPSGLTSDGVAVLTGAAQAGVQISAVNVMAMDYGDGAAPNPAGNMGTFAIDAATATDAQVASVLGISDAAAWPKIAVTPMIGVNDTSDEIFTLANAQQLAAFAATKHLAWLSMWSAARDQQCPGGAQPSAEPTCSSIVAVPARLHDRTRRLLSSRLPSRKDARHAAVAPDDARRIRRGPVRARAGRAVHPRQRAWPVLPAWPCATRQTPPPPRQYRSASRTTPAPTPSTRS